MGKHHASVVPLVFVVDETVDYLKCNIRKALRASVGLQAIACRRVASDDLGIIRKSSLNFATSMSLLPSSGFAEGDQTARLPTGTSRATITDMERIRIEQHTWTGTLWLFGWLFTIGYLHLTFWKGALAIVLWPYYIGVAFSSLAPH